MLPATILEATEENTRIVRKDHYLYELLHNQPNDLMDSFEFFEAMQTQALDHGNAFAFLTRAKSGKILSLLPLQADRMQVKVDDRNQLQYVYQTSSGTTEVYDKEEIFHFKPHTKDGITGRTPIQVAADVLGFSLALQEHGNKLFENGAFHSGFVQAPHAFKDDDARSRFMDSFKRYFGAKNAGKVGLLEQGTTFKESSMNNRDAQFLEAKEFSVIEIARLYRMPPALIQSMEKGMAFASIEQLNIMFVQYTIQPWITRWERAFKRQLLTQEGEDTLQVKFNVAALLRGDMLNRTQAIVNQLQYGLLTINEARELEDRNPIEEDLGDKPLISHNLRPVDEPLPKPQTGPGKPQEGKPAQKDEPSEERTAMAFLPLFRSILGRYVRRAREKKPDDIKKLAKDALIPGLEAYFQCRGKLDAAKLAEIAGDMFFFSWQEELNSNTRASEPEDAEVDRRARELIRLVSNVQELNYPSNPIVQVHTGPNVLEFKAEPPAKRKARVYWQEVNGKREAVFEEQ